MSSKKKESTPAPQPVQDPALTALLSQQARNATTQSNLSTGLYGDEAKLLGGLMRGEQPTGIYSGLGQGYGAGVESSIFNRNRDTAFASLANAGLMDSGVRAELENQAATDVSIASADRSRNDLMNLIQMALGGAGQMYGTAGQGMQTAIQGYTPREQQFNQLNQQNWIAQMNADAQRSAANAQLWSGLFQGMGSLAGGALGGPMGAMAGGSLGQGVSSIGGGNTTNSLWNFNPFTGKTSYSGR